MSAHEREERSIQGFGGGELRERDHTENLGVDGWIILKGMFKKWYGDVWTGLIWPRKGGGLL